jgi:hypothetical protein
MKIACFDVKLQTPAPLLGDFRASVCRLVAVLLCAILLSGCDILKDMGLVPDEVEQVDKPPVSVSFSSIGSTETGKTTTSLTLVFDPDIPGLDASNITVADMDPGGNLSGITATALYPVEGSPGVYALELGWPEEALAVDGKAGTLVVRASKHGYVIAPSSQEVDVYAVPLTPIVTVTAAADGVPNTATTTQLTLTLNLSGQSLPELASSNIYIAGNNGNNSNIHLTSFTGSGDGGSAVYTLTLDGIDAEGSISVTPHIDGYLFTPSLQVVTVHYVQPVALTVVPNGTASVDTTTSLTLTFNPSISLDANDISLTGATKGALSGKGPYSLAVSNIAADITVTVSKGGYRINNGSSVQVTANRSLINAANSSSIKVKFGIAATGTPGVTETFKMLSTFIKAGGLDFPQIKTGDWIDLEGGLSVTEYNKTEGFTATNTVVTSKQPPGYDGKTLRLIVVGINSFINKNGNNQQHVVFQFQNIPVTSQMNSFNTNAGGYANSEMRTYLTGNFLTGLIAAGVPVGVLWAPMRYVAKEYNNTTETVEIPDFLWLPTVREMFGANDHYPVVENAANQARLEYYSGDMYRIKHTGSNTPASYWVSSPYMSTSSHFWSVLDAGTASGIAANSTSPAVGVAPAFCVY